MKKVRIINKSREGVILDGQVKLTWAQFNSMYYIGQSPMYAIPTPAYQAKLEQINDLVNNLTVHVLASDHSEGKDKLMHLSEIGSLTDKIVSVSGMTIDQISQLVQKKIKAMHTFELQQKAAYRKAEKAKVVQERAHKISNATSKLGDVKGFDKLKEMIK